MQERDEVPVSSVVLPRRRAARRRTRAFCRASDLDNSACVAAALREYLKNRLGMNSLAFAEEPAAYADGFETYSYHFQLQSPQPLPSVYARPLTVRIYYGPRGLPRVRREMLVQRHLYQLNYPVAEPLFAEESCAYLGGPFLIMARVPGRTLLAGLLGRPRRLFRSPVRMAEAQVQLHLLDTAGFPRCEGPLLDRRLDEMATLIRDHGLQGLRPGLDWLVARRPGPPEDPRILHLDFHPLNLIESPNGSLVVLDWNEADVGDRHADVGTTLMLMECLPPIHVTRFELFFVRMGRLVFLPQYLHAYRRHLPLEEDKLSYYRAQAAFRRLCNYGRWLHDGPEVSGNKPAMLQCITDGHRQTLERYFWKWTGVRVRL